MFAYAVEITDIKIFEFSLQHKYELHQLRSENLKVIQTPCQSTYLKKRYNAHKVKRLYVLYLTSISYFCVRIRFKS